MVKKTIIPILALLLWVFSGCFNQAPEVYDGDLTIRIYVEYEEQPLANAPVTIYTYDYNFESLTDTTDSSGVVEFENLSWAQYSTYSRGLIPVPSVNNPGYLDTLFLSGALSLEISNDSTHLATAIITDTLEVIAVGTDPGIKINEIYSSGPPNRLFWFYDQFYELYNSSDDTLYLDGMIFCRMGSGLANVTYIFQFPGTPLTGQQYPIAPDSFVVVAMDAIDCRTIISTSIDLSDAEYEFRNSLDYADFDNPNAFNLDNLETGNTLDFMVGLTGDVVLIADGSDLDYTDGIDLESVVDCVEWSSSSTHIKEIEDALDSGCGGVGISRYSGYSIERISPGFDTNNSTTDFQNRSTPTPGYQYTGE